VVVMAKSALSSPCHRGSSGTFEHFGLLDISKETLAIKVNIGHGGEEGVEEEHIDIMVMEAGEGAGTVGVLRNAGIP